MWKRGGVDEGALCSKEAKTRQTDPFLSGGFVAIYVVEKFKLQMPADCDREKARGTSRLRRMPEKSAPRLHRQLHRWCV